MAEEPQEMQDLKPIAETQSTGLSDSLLIRESLKQLRGMLTDLVSCFKSDPGIQYQYVSKSIDQLRDKQERMMTEIARLDAEVIRAHQRLDAASNAVSKLNKEVFHAGPNEASG